jgi:hypothetical protein
MQERDKVIVHGDGTIARFTDATLVSTKVDRSTAGRQAIRSVLRRAGTYRWL